MSHDPSNDPTLPPDPQAEFETLEHPKIVGPYRILQVIGEGGMGVVYQAEQVEPIRRRVAVKMMKVGMDTKEVVARFEAERQALAVMDHPNIAKVLDAGVSALGRPYFVMEYVRGVPLERYCDSKRLTTSQRIELFILICQGVQHAHQKGVIHRDLKPSNVLVTEQDGQAIPKIIDFGIAKAVGQQLTERTLVTAFGYALGTPAYMSPEQAEAADLDVDTRSDVYALGVLLYELLVGRLPVDPAEIGLQGFIAQLVTREMDAPTPSVRLNSLGDEAQHVAAVRSTDWGSLRKEIKGDLDWILMKAMEKDRNRRFQTASGLADDLRRFVRNEPITARPPSARYRVQKFARRHRAAVGFASALTLLILAFAVTMTVQAGVIARERDRAEQEAAKAQAVNDFMEETLLAPDPIEGLGRDVTVVDALGVAAAKLDDAFPEQPEVEATARSAIGWAYFQLGRYDEAEPLLQETLRIRRQVLPLGHSDIAESLYQWARLHHVRAQYDSAESLYEESLSMRRASLGSRHPDVAESLKYLGIMFGELGRYEEAQSAFEDALAIQRTHAADRLEIADLENQLGVLLWNHGKYEQLEPLWLEMLDTRRTLLGEEHPLVAESMNNLAVLYDNTNRPEEAERYYRQALAMMRKTLGAEHEEVSAAMGNLAILLDSKGEYAEAEPLYREALRIDRKQLGDSNPAVASDLVNLGAMLCEIDRAGEALPMLDEAIETLTASLEPAHWRIGNTYQWKGRCLTKLRRFAEAERDFLTGLEMMTNTFGEDHMRVDRVRSRLAELYDAWGKPEKAAEYRGTGKSGGDDR